MPTDSLLLQGPDPPIPAPARLTLGTPIPLAEDTGHELKVKAQIMQSE